MTTREQLIEAMARAICNHWKNAKYYGDQWPEVSSHLTGQADDFRAKAAEALTAIEAAGLCIVPVEATEAERLAARKAAPPFWRDTSNSEAWFKRVRKASIEAGKL